MHTRTAKIVSIEYCLPKQVLTNDALATLYPDWSAEKIYLKTGISKRHIASQDECSSDLGVKAAQNLLGKVGVKPEDIDVLIFCTQTPDYCIPTTACIVQYRLGLPTSCAAFDINLGCSGFVYGLWIASAFILSGMADNALLITADTDTRLVHPLDKSLRIILGDAGAAALIRADCGIAHVGDFVLGTDGSGYQRIIAPASGFRIPKNAVTAIEEQDEIGNVRSLDNLYMDGPKILTFTMRVVPKNIQKLLDKAEVTSDDIDWFIFHQANSFIIQHLTKRLRIPECKVPLCLENYGNTASSSIPIALKDCQEQGLFRNGDLIMLVSFGVGYSWGSALLEWVDGKHEQVPEENLV